MPLLRSSWALQQEDRVLRITAALRGLAERIPLCSTPCDLGLFRRKVTPEALKGSCILRQWRREQSCAHTVHATLTHNQPCKVRAMPTGMEGENEDARSAQALHWFVIALVSQLGLL